MYFITSDSFPVQPPFLVDIDRVEFQRKPLVFNTEPSSGRDGKGYLPRHTINDKLFKDKVINQCMNLNATEEWTLENKTTNIAHPFHIHINPFQIVALFQPNSAAAKDPKNECYADPTNPETWKKAKCVTLPRPWVWWDAFSVPTARQDKLPTSVCTQVSQCPANIRQYTTCSGGTCTVTIPGYFKMRSRFVDFTGQYVLHCHILAHEDRGMMELVAVEGKCKQPYDVPTEYSHH
jgi:FtsP/CotA-like multicopper oxidase with cupredoxin domain